MAADSLDRAKQEAAAANDDATTDAKQFDPEALDLAIGFQLLKRDNLVYKALIRELLQEIGKGPWSDDPGQFGKQFQQWLQTAIQRGFKASIVDTARGSEVTIEEHWDEENLNPFQQYAEEVLDAEAARRETMQRKDEAQMPPEADDKPLA